MPELTEGKAQLATQVDQDVKDTIARLAKLEGVSQGDLVGIAIRAYDAEPKVIEDAPELADDASIVLLIPRDRDMLIQSLANLLHSCEPYIHSTEVWKAFAIARQTFQKSLPEYQTAEKMRAELTARREAGSRPLSYTKKGPSLT